MDSAENRISPPDESRMLECSALRLPVTVMVVCLGLAALAHAQTSADPHRLVPEVQANPAFPLAAPTATDNAHHGTATAVPPNEFADSGKTPIDRSEAQGQDVPVNASAGNPIWTTLGLLCLLLSGLFAVLKLLNRYGPRRFATGDPQHIQTLDRKRLDSQNTVYLLRVGRRVIVAAGSSGGLNTLAEIGDPEEVAELCGRPPQSGADADTLGSLFSGAQAIRRESARPAPASDTGAHRKSPVSVQTSVPPKPRTAEEEWHA